MQPKGMISQFVFLALTPKGLDRGALNIEQPCVFKLKPHLV